VQAKPALRRLPVVRKTVALIAITIPLAFAACGDDDDDDTESAAPPETPAAEEPSGGSGGGSTVDISETEFALDPADPTASAGSVTFNVTNDGSVVHNLEVEGNGVEEETDTITESDASVTVDLKPGTYEYYCPVDGHKAAGMKGTLTVK
jgi:plastocyanin